MTADGSFTDPVFGVESTPCHHWGEEGFVGGCSDCHRDEYVAEIFRLRRLLVDALEELDGEHQPEWVDEQAKADGKEPLWCRICGSRDGSWPCVSQMVADDITRGLYGRVERARVIADGFGSEWLTCGPNCGLHVVRPGKVQCACDFDEDSAALRGETP